MFPKSTRLIFSFRKIGNGPGTIKFGILSFGIHFMKFSTLKVFQGSSVNFVIRLSNTQVSTWTTLSPLPQWAVIKNLVAHPQILAMQPKTTFQIYFKSTMTTMPVIQLQKMTSKMQFSTFSSPGIFHSIKQTVHTSEGNFSLIKVKSSKIWSQSFDLSKDTSP